MQYISTAPQTAASKMTKVTLMLTVQQFQQEVNIIKWMKVGFIAGLFIVLTELHYFSIGAPNKLSKLVQYSYI